MRTRVLRSLFGWLEVGHGRDVGAVYREGGLLSGVRMWWRGHNGEQRYMYYGARRGGADNLGSLCKQHSPVLSSIAVTHPGQAPLACHTTSRKSRFTDHVEGLRQK